VSPWWAGPSHLKLLFIGDVVGRPGREAVRACLADLVRRHQVDFTIANAENAAGGLGITQAVGEELLQAGIDVLTTGNHVWRQREAVAYLAAEPRVLRPANFPPAAPGRGAEVFTGAHTGSVGVLGLQGRTFMEAIDCPFRTADSEIEALRGRTNVIIVDMHAEATSEKLAMGWYLDGRVSAVIGTHTHVQTADERILPKGTAYISDAGMTGPLDSILGVKSEAVIQRFLTGLPSRFELAGGPLVLNGVVVDINPETGAANAVERVVEYVTP
jgi:metallophosphoesterase (TIGR00282 family)